MVKINENLLKCCTSRHSIKSSHKEGSITKELSQVTHLYLQSRKIHHIEKLESCPKLLALYLYENSIFKIENLSVLRYLTCLYLQDNRIKKMENLEELRNLNALNLARNEIRVVEGLDQQTALQQLWVENQQLPADVRLMFDPPSIRAISKSLKLLNISGNRICSLKDLEPLDVLETLYLEDNELHLLQDLVNSLIYWGKLTLLKLNGNSVCKARKYRDNIVVNCKSLEELDGKVVTQSYKEFLMRWRESQLKISGNSGGGDRFLEAFVIRPEIIPCFRSSAVMSLPNLESRKINDEMIGSHKRETVSDENVISTHPNYT